MGHVQKNTCSNNWTRDNAQNRAPQEINHVASLMEVSMKQQNSKTTPCELTAGLAGMSTGREVVQRDDRRTGDEPILLYMKSDGKISVFLVRIKK